MIQSGSSRHLACEYASAIRLLHSVGATAMKPTVVRIRAVKEFLGSPMATDNLLLLVEARGFYSAHACTAAIERSESDDGSRNRKRGASSSELVEFPPSEDTVRSLAAASWEVRDAVGAVFSLQLATGLNSRAALSLRREALASAKSTGTVEVHARSDSARLVRCSEAPQEWERIRELFSLHPAEFRMVADMVAGFVNGNCDAGGAAYMRLLRLRSDLCLMVGLPRGSHRSHLKGIRVIRGLRPTFEDATVLYLPH